MDINCYEYIYMLINKQFIGFLQYSLMLAIIHIVI